MGTLTERLGKAGAIVLFALGCGQSPSTAPKDDHSKELGNNQRQTDLGAVRGVSVGGTLRFLGIPYAAPPVGGLRFQPPQTHDGWDGVRDATTFGEICAQLDPISNSVVGSEDCLTLNIWTPSSSPSNHRPVMVWIHGGDNVSGSASDPGFFGGYLYNGQALSERGDVVLVSIQYRVGAFGFLSHADFAGDNQRGSTGNWGLMDQVAALQWIQRNIHAFGGNPSNVTLFGQSAGADNVCALVTSTQTAGLMHRAIMMSPGGCHTNDAVVSARTTRVTTTALGCSGLVNEIECLRMASVESLARAPQSGAPLHPDRVDFYIEIDGWLLTETPLQTFRAGTQNKIPLVIGTTAEEYALILNSVLPASISPTEYPLWMAELFGANLADEVAAAYPPTEYGSTRIGLIAAHGDAVHHCSVRAVARAAAATQSPPLYRYVLGHAYDEPRLAPFGAAHGFDIPLVFASLEGFALTPDDEELSDRFLRTFADFAQTGSQGSGGDWPRFEGPSDNYAVADVDWRTLTGFRRPQCDFWDSLWDGPHPP